MPSSDLGTDTAENTADEAESDPADAGAACLVVAFQAESPLSEPRRYLLSGIDRVRLGRRTTQPPAPGELSVELGDPFVSSPHAVLRRVSNRWLLEDEGSRNGTFVDADEIDRCELEDGAVIELGRTMLVFRARVPDRSLPRALDEYPTLHFALAARLGDLQRLAPSEVPVMLRGATGTGKEVIAHAVHRLSGRSGPFQAINCAALSPALAESELFGYRKGAFSGAAEDRPGLIRAAQGGTLFLDEVGDLPLAAQAALLRVLQQREVLPVGATRPVAVDFRLVVATHRDLEQMVEAGTFRADFLARIGGFRVSLPLLEERREDLGLIVAALLRRHAPAHGDSLRFSLRAARALFRARWPLNIRELEQVLALSLPFAAEGRIEATHFPAARAAATGERVAEERLSPAEKQLRAELVEALRANAGNVTGCARAMGKARQQVQRWMRRHGLKSSDFR